MPRPMLATVVCSVAALVAMQQAERRVLAPMSSSGSVAVTSRGVTLVGTAEGLFVASGDATTRVAAGQFATISVSRSGDTVVFARADANDDGRIWTTHIVAATGQPTGDARQVAKSIGDSPVISPDGKFVVFARDENTGQSVAIVNIEDGAERVLASGANSIGIAGWSVDGGTVFYTANTARERNIWPIHSVAVSGGAPTVVIADNIMPNPRLSPDGRRILHLPAAGSHAIASIDGTAVSRIRVDSREAGVNANGIAWRNNGSEIVAVERLRGAGLAISSAGGTPSRVLAEGGFHTFTTVSPDGKTIATLSREGERPVVMLRAFDGSAARVIRTQGVPYDGQMKWSPDSKWLAVRTGAVMRAIETAATGIEVVERDSNLVHRLETADDIRRIQWRPDSRAIRYFTQRPGATEAHETGVRRRDSLVRTLSVPGRQTWVDFDHAFMSSGAQIFDLRTGEPQNIAGMSAAVRVPGAPASGVEVFSPDGRFFAFPSSSRGNNQLDQLTVITVSTGESQPIALNFTALNSRDGLSWHPNGRSVFVAGMETGTDGIYLVQLDGGAPRRVAAIGASPDRVPGALQFGLSPDGSQVVHSVTQPATFRLVEIGVRVP